jgi:hypothetical protein
MKKITIIIVTWNCFDYVAALLNSLLESQERQYPVIIVDNCSTDGTPDRIEQQYSQVTVLRQKVNRGFAWANNLAADHAQTEYLLFLNPDTLLTKGSFEELIEYLQGNQRAAVVGCKLHNADGTLQLSCHRDPSFWKNIHDRFRLGNLFPRTKLGGYYNYSYWDHNEAKAVDYVCGAAFLVRRMDFLRIGGFDARFFMYFEDADLCKRLKTAGSDIMYYPFVEVKHFGGGSTGLKNEYVRFWEVESQFLYLMKHAHRYVATIYLVIMVFEFWVRRSLLGQQHIPPICGIWKIKGKKQLTC